MKTIRIHRGFLLAATALLSSLSAFAAPPVVKTVPWVDASPLVAHSTYPGKTIRLKGTCDQAGSNLHWTWDFGDGSAVATGTVTDRYVIEAQHAYAGAVGTTYTARLTVANSNTGESANHAYYVKVQSKAQDVEVNIAIDEGLWYLHKNLVRTSSGGIDYGYWSPTWVGLTAANLNAFEVNGHKESGSAGDPYTETVGRALRWMISNLTTRGIGNQQNPLGIFNPDSNLNGHGVVLNQSYPYYQGGMVIDALVASGTPNAVAVTGPSGVIGQTYATIVQDMVDDHAWAQYDASPGGGWRYVANEYPDNSVCQWAAIGMIAAERNWGLTVPAIVKQWNVRWLASTQNSSTGWFGYTDTSPVWGPYATTPSGMVQMVLDGIGRGMTGPNGAPSWDKAETFIRDNFGNSGGYGSSIKAYYYGMFSFVKSMLLSTPPIVTLQSKTPGVPPIDWYGAETSKNDPTDGVARTLINGQSSNGSWTGHDASGDQYAFETAWAVMMLHRTLFESGAPVAVAVANPNPAVAGQIITLDGTDSFHQDSSKSIVSWQWDVNSDGIYETSGPKATTSFNSVGLYPIKLLVTDNNVPPRTAEAIIIVDVATPPLAPTADADGPYTFCSSMNKWFLNGLNSTNPDEGQHEPGMPGDTIAEYAWDLDGNQAFDDAYGPTPDVKAYFASYPPGSYLVSLKVTDTTATSYPSSGMSDLSSVASTIVRIVAPAEPECACIPLKATPEVGGMLLEWGSYGGAHHYNVYRGLVAGGPYLWVGSAPGLLYHDLPGALNRAYYYVVRPAELNGDELCQSNEASGEPLHPSPTVTCKPSLQSNLGRWYYELGAGSLVFGDEQLKIWVGDTGSGLIAGPFVDENIVRIRKTGVAKVGSAPPGISALITTVGQARVWSTDPFGQKSAEIIFTP